MQTILLVLVPVLIGVVGQLFLKKGMSLVGQFDFGLAAQIVPQFVRAFTNPWVLAGFIFYFVSSLFWMIVLSRVDLSFAYPLLSLGYAVVLLASFFFFREPVSAVRWLGVLVIMLGVTLISRS
ncbi:transporter EamA family [Candidatus Termititenax persephonae]|uniref:Transporter EamA family n=1 Tax=Candidatus Termititenax persephonae TaxID=2218525 RepID=A0A388TFQ8_9BACT|nr:transporter EamA family [Candidatus Termititenax persephonae]